MFNVLGELEHAISLSMPKIIFATKTTFEKIANLAKNKKFINKVIFIGDIPRFGTTTFKTFVSNPKIRSNIKEFKCQAQDTFNNVSLILCSSGTTGMPKGVQLTERNIEIGVAQHL